MHQLIPWVLTLENEVFRPIFQPGKSWEYFHGFVAAIAEPNQGHASFMWLGLQIAL